MVLSISNLPLVNVVLRDFFVFIKIVLNKKSFLFVKKIHKVISILVKLPIVLSKNSSLVGNLNRTDLNQNFLAYKKFKKKKYDIIINQVLKFQSKLYFKMTEFENLKNFSDSKLY